MWPGPGGLRKDKGEYLMNAGFDWPPGIAANERPSLTSQRGDVSVKLLLESA
jgi:hypothetical protein